MLARLLMAGAVVTECREAAAQGLLAFLFKVIGKEARRAMVEVVGGGRQVDLRVVGCVACKRVPGLRFGFAQTRCFRSAGFFT